MVIVYEFKTQFINFFSIFDLDLEKLHSTSHVTLSELRFEKKKLFELELKIIDVFYLNLNLE